MRLLLTLVVAVSLLVSCSCGLPHHVRDGSFTTRSGQIALGFASDELFSVSAPPSATLFFKAAAPLSSPLPSTLPDYQLADFLAHSLGLSPLHLDDGRLDRSAYPRSAAFAKPAASLLVVFDGAAPASVRQHPAVHVTPSYLSQSTLSTLETIFAGAAPSAHGVIADSWYCFETHAVVDAMSPAGLPFAPSFFDLAAAAADPASLQLVVAADDQLAVLLGAAASDDKPVDLAYLQMKLGACAGASLSVSGEQVRIALADHAATAVFDLTERRHAELLAQLSGVFHLVDELTCADGPYAQLTRDAAPDMFVVGFASLDGLSADARAVATALIDSVVEQATEQLSQLYHGRLLAAYLAVSADLPANMVDACSSLGHLDWVADVSVLPLAKTCPAVYLSPSLSAEQIGSLRTQLSEDLAPFGVAAFVLPQHYAMFFRAANDTDNGNQTDDGSAYTGADVAMFQIILWTSIVLFLTLVATLSGMFCLTWEGENSPVFIETNSIQKNNIDPSNI